MKALTIMSVLCLAAILISCGGDTQQREFAERQESLTEETAEPTLAEVIATQIDNDFYTGEPAFKESDWERMQKLSEELTLLREGSEERFVAREDLHDIFVDHGYADFDEGRRDILKYAGLQDVTMSLAMRSGEIRTRRAMGDEKTAEESKESLINHLKQRELTKSDLDSMVENNDIIGKAVAMQFIVNSAR